MLYLWLYPLHTDIAIFNVFRYLSFRIIYAALTAFVIAFFLAPPMIKNCRNSDWGNVSGKRGRATTWPKKELPPWGAFSLFLPCCCPRCCGRT